MPYSRLDAIAKLLNQDWCQSKSASDCLEELGVSLEQGGFYFPQSCVINGPQYCRELVDSNLINLLAGHVEDPPTLDTPTILAVGCDIPNWPQLPPLETAILDGQIDSFELRNLQQIPRVALVSDGYVVPNRNTITAGSTYEYRRWPEGESTETNRRRIETIFPNIQLDWVGNFRARRLVTSDRFPVAGKVAENLWLSVGFGSSGTTTAPFIAEILASEIVGELSPSSRGIIEVMDPWRFVERQKRRPNPFERSSRTRLA